MTQLSPADQDRIAAMFPIYEKPETPTAVLKLAFRELAAQILTTQNESQTQAAKRSCSLALTELETASMYAVKALHQG